ncbi:ABC transporter ATP-binding protein [Burkholderia pseudomallei]|uniref:ABC transporter ATP-binding protein n=1 Tax=Burkholderia pseudomallei TaxID=28450 RepID=UPI000977129A|nr:ABC transporter ATP-binding protein [Burkholderia pseudomallei]ONC93951.1 branched-chain amino acid ABC transporter substrate-binding protein [Burkholderia pseudomallei]OND05753.1 branched-chain amino acid ABC transporter substrate-binding protein [Burkholderia pseudomallei]OND16633.1 branched-chain amino acid ABC transporter substrate-binding protein [Burkholderia pseudomallei]OND19635.1 branched-chain amino acid ABC transporter substrate-binding protein [Burkholderia pseudomallei]OND20474
MTAAFLQIQRLRKTYDDVVAIDHVSLDVRKGEFMTFLGPSGSGKSTTLYIVAGFQEPTEGCVLLDGRPLLSVAPNKRNTGMVFQRYTLFPHLTVGENVAFPLRVRRRPDAQVKAKVEQMLKLVHLADCRDRMPAQLSGGQQQRVAIARALAYDPPVLLMDEPLAALDKKLREEIQLELRRIHQETGVTILYVTHDQEEALRLSDRIAVFNKGAIEQVGTGEELYANPTSRFVASFIGNSNFLPVRVTANANGGMSGIFPNGLAVATAGQGPALTAGHDGALMLRPEQMRIRALQGATGEVGLPVTVRDITYLGDAMHYAVATPWQQEISIRMPASHRHDSGLSIGTQAFVEWDARDARVFVEA